MDGHSHDELLHSIEIATREVGDNRHWLLRIPSHIAHGLRSALDAASRLTNVFEPRKDYAALIAKLDTQALSGARAGAYGVSIAQELFSGSIASFFSELPKDQDHLPKINNVKYDQLESGIRQLNNAYNEAGARLKAIGLGFENALGYRQADRWLEKYKRVLATTKFGNTPTPSSVGDALGLTSAELGKLRPEHRARVDFLLRNLADHARTDLAFMAGTNGAAQDNRDGLVLLKALIDGAAGRETDTSRLPLEKQNAISYRVDPATKNISIGNERADLHMLDESGNPVFKPDGMPRKFFEIANIYAPNSAGWVAGLLQGGGYKMPEPGATLQSMRAAKAERRETARSDFKAPAHPVPHGHSLQSEVPAETL